MNYSLTLTASFPLEHQPKEIYLSQFPRESEWGSILDRVRVAQICISGYPGRYIADALGDYDLFGRVSRAVHIDGRQLKNVRRYSSHNLDVGPIDLCCIHEMTQLSTWTNETSPNDSHDWYRTLETIA